jgi:hypothetical protein
VVNRLPPRRVIDPWRGSSARWDRDGDGIPNGRDHVFNPVWDRDGDGIANRYDRRDNLRRDHDGDGVPNGRDGSPWGRR